MQLPFIKDGWDIEYQYMYGTDLLVAPVTNPEETEWTVYLPGEGQGWVWLWDRTETVRPGKMSVIVEAPWGLTPVFYKVDSPWTDLFRQIRDEFNLI